MNIPTFRPLPARIFGVLIRCVYFASGVVGYVLGAVYFGLRDGAAFAKDEVCK